MTMFSDDGRPTTTISCRRRALYHIFSRQTTILNEFRSNSSSILEFRSNLMNSSSWLSEGYVANISDFSFWSVEISKSKMRSPSMQLLEASATNIESNVFHFGVVLFEIITDKISYMEDDSCVADWVLEMLEKGDISRQSMDPTLNWFQEEQV